MRNDSWARGIPGAMLLLLITQPHGYAAKASVKPHGYAARASVKPHGYAARPSARPVHHVGKRPVEKKPVSVQIVSFPETEWHAVKIIRGGTPAKDETAGVEPAEKAEAAEIVTFGDSNSKPVRVVRGDTARAEAMPGRPLPVSGTNRELVTFLNPRDQPVTVLRGSIAQSLPGIELFRPASESDLDRVAFAVDGAESSHGTDLRMWRPELSGPQGPMQVSPPRRLISAAATGSTWSRTDNWAAAISRACTGDMAIGRMRSRHTTGVQATWMRGSAPGAPAPASRSR